MYCYCNVKRVSPAIRASQVHVISPLLDSFHRPNNSKHRVFTLQIASWQYYIRERSVLVRSCRAPCKYTTARYAGIQFRNNLFVQDYDNRVSICAVINFSSIFFPVFSSIGQFNSKIASLHECPPQNGSIEKQTKAEWKRSKERNCESSLHAQRSAMASIRVQLQQVLDNTWVG